MKKLLACFITAAVMSILLLASGCSPMSKKENSQNKDAFTIDAEQFKQEVTDYFEMNKFEYIKPSDDMFKGMKNGKGFSFELYGENLNQVKVLKISVPLSAVFDSDMKSNMNYLERLFKCTINDDQYAERVAKVTKFLKDTYYSNGVENKIFSPIVLKDRKFIMEIKDCVLYVKVTANVSAERSIKQSNTGNSNTTSK